MKKITVSICTGTACYVMGASEILILEDSLPEELKEIVEVRGITCLDKCKNSECGKAPFVLVNDEDATVKQFYQDGSNVTLVPKSTNAEHAPQFYNLKDTKITVLGKVVRNLIDF